MKKIPIIISIVVALIIIWFGVSFFYIMQDPTELGEEIDKANYCEAKDDCVRVGSVCPLGCHIYVNKNEEGKIRNLLNSYRSNCVYKCQYCPDFECAEGKCQPICE